MESVLFGLEMDINCDLGEGIGNDHEIMAYLDSCNIACGGHAGNAQSMRDTVMMAQRHGVKIGAHPSFIDREHFGRKELKVPKQLLKSQLMDQIENLNEIVASFGTGLHHVKPHGALYNLAAKSTEMAELVIEVMQELNEGIYLYVPFNSVIESLARQRGISICVEVFADRHYNDDFSLVSRTAANAIIEDPEDIKLRIDEVINRHCITSLNGVTKRAAVDTICIHGDHVNAVQIAKLLYDFKNQIN